MQKLQRIYNRVYPRYYPMDSWDSKSFTNKTTEEQFKAWIFKASKASLKYKQEKSVEKRCLNVFWKGQIEEQTNSSL